MSRTPKLDAQGLRERRHWPALPPDVQDALLAFLAYYRAEAELGAVKAAELAAIASEDLGMRGTADHWARTVKVIDWLLHRIPQRQRYLEIQLAQKEGRWIPPEPAPAT